MVIAGKPKRTRNKSIPVTLETTLALKEEVTQTLREAIKLTDLEMSKCGKRELPSPALVKRHNRYAYSFRTMKDVDVNEHNYRMICKDLRHIEKDVKKYITTHTVGDKQELES